MKNKNEEYIQSEIHTNHINKIIKDFIKGMPRREIIPKYMKLLNRSEESVRRLVQEAFETLKVQNDEEKEELRGINMARLEDMYSKCYADKNYKEARNMIDSMGKYANIYNTNVNVTNDKFTFDFQNDGEGITSERSEGIPDKYNDEENEES